MLDDLENRRALLQRTMMLLGRVSDQFCSPDGPQYGLRFTGDVDELASALNELGLKSLGARLGKEAADAAEAWFKAFGVNSFLMSFEPDHESHCMAAWARQRIFSERLQELFRELEPHIESFSLRTNLELAVLKDRVMTIAKTNVATRWRMADSQVVPPAIAPDIRRRACDVLERISTQCSEAAGPKEFGIRVVLLTCRPDTEEAAGCLSQLGMAPQSRRLKVAYNAVVEEFGKGFAQDGSCELEENQGKAPPPSDEEKADRQARCWRAKRVVAELGEVARSLQVFLNAGVQSNRVVGPLPTSGSAHEQVRQEASDPTSQNGDQRQLVAVPVTGEEARDTVNKMLSNDPPWDWKRTRKWLDDHEVCVFDRNSWKKTSKTDPPKIKGNVALVNEGELTAAIRAELKIRESAFETMDEVARLHEK